MTEPEEYSQFLEFDVYSHKARLSGYFIVPELDYVLKDVQSKVIYSCLSAKKLDITLSLKLSVLSSYFNVNTFNP